MPPKKPENEEDKASRLRLQRLLKRARKFLDRVHAAATAERSGLTLQVRRYLTTLWSDSSSKIDVTHESLTVGASASRRNSLHAAGLFGAELEAKEGLLAFLLEENHVIGALKLLASIFGSLSKIFPILSAVKEFIDAVLCVRDWMVDPQFTSIGPLA